MGEDSGYESNLSGTMMKFSPLKFKVFQRVCNLLFSNIYFSSRDILA